MYPTVSDIIKEHLGDPPIYYGYPVDLSDLDIPIKGYVEKEREDGEAS